MPGKQAWFDENRPREGKSAEEVWVGDVAGQAVPACGLQDRIGAVRDRVRAAGQQVCVVLNEERILLGMLRQKALEGDRERIAGEVMDPGPKTFRPSATLEQMLAWMREHDVQTVALVTTSLGRFCGAISRADAEATLAHDHAHDHDHVDSAR
ncbi:MAG TPA: CBS domain-containing protein [Candidatus Limnocylindrales bacterium]|nr:CBS domain-containing protein [Candidatus Limnocylindrales bacterium]